MVTKFSPNTVFIALAKVDFPDPESPPIPNKKGIDDILYFV